MIDVNSERLFSLPQASKFPCFNSNGRPPAPSTIWRWTTFGVVRKGQRIKLEAVAIGTRLHTSREAAARFITALTEAAGHPAPAPHPSIPSIKRDEATLQAAGVI